jgi:alkylhydroperoxidase family enzyme
VPPVPPRQWSEAARAAVAILSEPASRIGLEPSDDTHVHNLVCTQLQHPELMKAYFPFLQYLLRDGVLEPRLRELAILRVAWLRQAEYEWTQHVLISRSVGVTDGEISRLAGEIDAADWDPADALVIQAVDELISSARMSDATWRGLSPNLGVKGMIELIHVIGNYDLIAMFMSSTGLDLEEDVEGVRFEVFAQA